MTVDLTSDFIIIVIYLLFNVISVIVKSIESTVQEKPYLTFM